MAAHVLLLWLQVISLVLFLCGFFPVKTPLTGYANIDDINEVPYKSVSNQSETWSQSRTHQVVVVLIDALRADFVIPPELLHASGIQCSDRSVEKIQFLGDMFQSGEAMAFVATANPPTVTLPRIKALTTGTIPGFVDVILNFGSSELMEDNLIYQLHSHEKKLLMFGDDTWLKLFPGKFERSDGTTSFFVSDYTEVDNNVTRHLSKEMSRDDWDVAILHYLGLDHIGHLAGPFSSLVRPKLDEMGSVIQSVYEAMKVKARLQKKPSLLIVLGDHGMSDAGSHGGASASETATPVVTIKIANEIKGQQRTSPKRIKRIHQQDLVPTLAALTGVPIPRNNIGIMIEDVIENQFKFPKEDLLGFWLYNAKQVAKVLKNNIRNCDRNPAYQQYLKALTLIQDKIEGKASQDIIRQLKSAIVSMSDTLSENLLEYDLRFMIAGIFLYILGIVMHFVKFKIRISYDLPVMCKWICMAEILRILSLASSSFVEEQHQTYFFLTTTSILLFFCMTLNREKSRFHVESLSLLLAMTLLRFGRTLNQTGDKWSHLPDYSDFLLAPENKTYLSLVHGLSLISLMVLTLRFQMDSNIVLATITLVPSFFLTYLMHGAQGKVAIPVPNENIIISEKGLIEAQITFSLIAMFSTASLLRQSAKTFESVMRILFSTFLVFANLLTQPQNTVLFVTLILLESILHKSIVRTKLSADKASLIYLLMGFSIYFMQGNSNSLATVDIASGYVGLSTFNPVIVGIFIACNTFSGPILAVILFHLRFGHQYGENAILLSLCNAFEVGVFLVLVTFQRHHLFVWTVFSPKLLYQGMWTLVLTILQTLIFTLKIIFVRNHHSV